MWVFVCLLFDYEIMHKHTSDIDPRCSKPNPVKKKKRKLDLFLTE